jgi:hypothetical protein
VTISVVGCAAVGSPFAANLAPRERGSNKLLQAEVRAA